MQPNQFPNLQNAKIPYYELRNFIEKSYNRRKILLTGCIIGGIAQVIIGVIQADVIIEASQREPGIAKVFALIGLLVALTLAGYIVAISWFTLTVTLDALNYTDKEEQLVQQCLECLHDQDAQGGLVDTLESMASHGVSGSQLFAVLPVALLTAVATFAAVDNLPVIAGVILAELLGLSMLSFALTIGQANADVIILKSIVEYRRQLALIATGVRI